MELSSLRCPYPGLFDAKLRQGAEAQARAEGARLVLAWGEDGSMEMEMERWILPAKAEARAYLYRDEDVPCNCEFRT